MKRLSLLFVPLIGWSMACKGQLLQEKEVFTHADTLRGTITPERAWWNVLRYDIQVTPDYDTKTIKGITTIGFEVTKAGQQTMQIDLQPPLEIDQVLADKAPVKFKKTDENVWYAYFDQPLKVGDKKSLEVTYHGQPREAINPPWDGGWIWKRDKTGNVWMSVACQGLGASVWYPCKDHQSDEPDNGASLSITVPDTLVAVGNGRLINTTHNAHNATYVWEVKNPINSYNIIPYIGKYVNFTDVLDGEKGKLDLSFWVLQEDLDKAKVQFKQAKPMLSCFEHWFGPYPFYEDSYKLVEAPHLGMEHQSAVAYGNKFMNGYLGRDLSGTGWGLKWDYIIVHESGHEWFANNITSNDIADMWVHEGFTDYSETLFTECQSGKEAANEYNYGQRKGIQNKEPIIGHYGVNKEGSGDMYPKGANLLHTIRHSINDDEKFRTILRGLNKVFYHKTVDTRQVEEYISKESGIDFTEVFNQYLRNTSIPVLRYYFAADHGKLFVKWSNCLKAFNLQIVLGDGNDSIRIKPTTSWTEVAVTPAQAKLISKNAIEKMYYITVEEGKD